MADIARAIQFAADAIYANDQFSASQASLAAELAVKMLDEAELLGGTLVGMREPRTSGQPAAGVKCPECGQTTGERGGCACVSETVWAKGPDWQGLAASLYDALQFECIHGDPECTCIADHAALAIAAYQAAHIDGVEHG